MKETTQENNTTTKYTQDTAQQGGHGSPAGAKEQAKEVLDNAAQSVEEAYTKTAQKVGECMIK